VADSRRARPYLFYDTATSVCATCLRRVEAKILLSDGTVVMEKWCPEHGRARVLLADDVVYWRRAREFFLKAPELPLRFSTPTRWGCPYDCGLCPDHMQHSCLTLLEITDRCNLRCPVCYAGSGPERTETRSLDEIEKMLDALVQGEGEPDVVQISGGEPTIHPDFFAILDAARRRPIRHLMVNTNGVRIAADAAFAERLASYAPGFEVYLQFDSLEEGPNRVLRGAPLVEHRLKALERLNALNLSTTLVVTVVKGLNDGEIGKIVTFALAQRCVRGVTLQPVQVAGRTDGVEPGRDRLTLTEVRRRLLEQCAVFRPEDVVPVPCNPDALAMAYALKVEGRTVPLTGLLDPEMLLAEARNTIVYEKDETVKRHALKLFSTGASPEAAAGTLKELLCCLPRVGVPAGLSYENLFRVLVVQFLDAHGFDTRVAKRSCIHMAQPDGRIIPFDTYNLFYRGDAALRLAALRAGVDAAFGDVGVPA
jgi:uncharacterized radical SAM superfamily Fe-S cluster-containing enzyme